MGFYTAMIVKNAKIKKRYQPLVRFIEAGHGWEEANEIFDYWFLKELSADERSAFIPGNNVEGYNGEWIQKQDVEFGFKNGYWSLYCDLKNYDRTIEKFFSILEEITEKYKVNQEDDEYMYIPDIDFIKVHSEDQDPYECTEIEL